MSGMIELYNKHNAMMNGPLVVKDIEYNFSFYKNAPFKGYITNDKENTYHSLAETQDSWIFTKNLYREEEIHGMQHGGGPDFYFIKTGEKKVHLSKNDWRGIGKLYRVFKRNEGDGILNSMLDIKSDGTFSYDLNPKILSIDEKTKIVKISELLVEDMKVTRDIGKLK